MRFPRWSSPTAQPPFSAAPCARPAAPAARAGAAVRAARGGNATATISLTFTRAGTAVTAETFGVAGAGGTAPRPALRARRTRVRSDGGRLRDCDGGCVGSESQFGERAGGQHFEHRLGWERSAYAASPAAGDRADATTVTTLGGGKPTFLNSNFNFLQPGTSWSYVTGLPTSFDASTPTAAFAGGTIYGLGSMAEVYGGAGKSLTYITTADFVFNYSSNSEFLLDIIGNSASGPAGTWAFNSSVLRVLVNGVRPTEIFASLAEWESVFFPGGLAGGPIDIGALLSGGLADVEIIFALTADSSSSSSSITPSARCRGHRRCPCPPLSHSSLPASVPWVCSAGAGNERRRRLLLPDKNARTKFGKTAMRAVFLFCMSPS